jgi:ABC-type nitrate/sulfonate/bicarbonate transport system permease component
MRALDRWSGVIFLFGLFAAWECLARFGLVSPQALPAPSAIARATLITLATGEFNEPVLTTLRQFIVGYAIAVVIAIPCGLALGRWAWAHAAFEPLIEFLRPMPVAGILPVVLFFLGYHDATAYAVIAFGAGWIVLLHAMDGIHGVDPVLVDTARVFRISTTRLFCMIVLPAAMPHIFTGLRVALGIALTLAVVVEMIAGFGGLGTYIGIAQGAVQVINTYSGIVMIGLLGYLLIRLFQAIEGRLMAWHRGATRR